MASTPVSTPQIAASANGRYFVNTSTNEPIVILADSAQSIVNIYGSDITTYLSTRASQGFNAIQIDLVATTYVNASTPYAAQTASGPVYAFTNNGAITSGWVANTAYWTLMDSYVEAIISYGMIPILNAYEGSTNSGGGGNDLTNAGNTACYNFGQFVGNRYKNLSYIMWQLGNDFIVNTTAEYQAQQNLANGILSVAPNQLMTIEVQNPGTPLDTSFETTYSPNSGSPAGSYNFLTVNGGYSYSVTYGIMMIAYNGTGVSFASVDGTNNSSPAPTMMLETNYEGENIAGDGTTEITYRKSLWWTGFSGCTAFIFGNHYIWDFASGWQSNLTTTGAANAVLWQQFMQANSGWKLQPDQGHVIGTAGYGTASATNIGSNFNTDDYVCVCADSLTGSATIACAYFSLGTAQTLTIALSKFAGTITAQWFDPTNAAYTTIGTYSNTGTHNFTPSGNNNAGDVDWVLVLTA